MLINRLKRYFELNEPIFTNEILEVMKEYSRPRIYQMIRKALKEGTLARFDDGIYYLPKQTEFGTSIISINQVVEKKYITNKNETFGIYGKYVIDLDFFISYQVPNVIEVITNNEARKIREITIRGRKIILRKSRVPITNQNKDAYTLMELFNSINLKQYQQNPQIRKAISDFINEKNITQNEIKTIAKAFPAKAIKNLLESGVLYEITQ